MNDIQVKLIRPFGPSILYARIPDKTINFLNEYVEKVIKDKNKTNLLNYGDKLAGHVTQEFLIEEDVANQSGWLSFLSNCVQYWINQEIKKNINIFKVIDSWIVRQFQNEYNPTHWHGGHISGAGFLKVPKNMGNNFQNKNQRFQGGNLQLIHGARMFLSPSTFNIDPKVGDFYFFPNYLMHTVFPFNGTDEERRSISFNALIDEKIHNIYS